MIMKDLISVIIPVYNSANYITPCLDSLCCQTYENLEILVVDDGSKDDSFAVCQAYAKKDRRVVALHQENQGVSVARNLGVEKATGTWIAFIDADDYVKADYFEMLHRDMVDNGADIVCCNMIELQNGRQVELSGARVLRDRLIVNQTELYGSMVEEKEFYASCVWAKLIKAELAKKHAFPRGMKIGEDQLYMYKLFSDNPSVYLDTYAGYYYIRNAASVMCRKTENLIARYMDEMEMYRYKAMNLPACAEKYKGAFFEKYAQGIYLAAMETATKGTVQEWKGKCATLRKRVMEIPASLVTKKLWIKVMLLTAFPNVFRTLYRLKYAGAKNS